MKEDKLNNITETGFKTPDYYFDSLEENLMQRLQETKFISDVEEPGFTVPEGYFKSIDGEIFNKLEKEETPVISLSSKKPLYYIAGIAASIVLILAIFINKPFEDEISIEMVETYLEDRDLSSYELAELLSDSDLLEDDFIITETSFKEDNLESYLLENSEIDLIIE
jgi:hypothetical protein